jgi:hypothetical protein
MEAVLLDMPVQVVRFVQPAQAAKPKNWHIYHFYHPRHSLHHLQRVRTPDQIADRAGLKIQGAVR